MFVDAGPIKGPVDIERADRRTILRRRKKMKERRNSMRFIAIVAVVLMAGLVLGACPKPSDQGAPPAGQMQGTKKAPEGMKPGPIVPPGVTTPAVPTAPAVTPGTAPVSPAAKPGMGERGPMEPGQKNPRPGKGAGGPG